MTGQDSPEFETSSRSRRRVLAALGSAATVALAGCSVEVGDDVEEPPTIDDGSDPTPGTEDGSSGGGSDTGTEDDSQTEGDGSESEENTEWTTDKEEFEGWPSPLYDHRNTSYKANATLPSDNHEMVWQTSVGDGGVPPIVADGTVYTYAHTGRQVTAIDADSGDVEWTFTGDELAQRSNAPAVSDEHVYVTGDRSLLAIDRQSGEQAWKFEVEGRARPPAVFDGTVYIGTGGPFYALDPSGEKIWENLVGNRFAIAAFEDTLYVGGWVLDRETGEKRGRYHGGTSTGPTVLNGRVFTADALSVDCFRDGVEGERVWQSPDLGAPVFSNLVLAHGHVYCYTRGTDTLHALDISTGEQVWTAERSMSGSLAATPEALLVWDDGVRALNPADGSERWGVEIDASYGNPVPVDGTVYATADPSGEDDAYLYAIE